MASTADANKTITNLQASIDTVTDSLANLTTQMSKISSQVASLQPLVPLATRLRDLPEKLEAAAFEYAQDTRALEAAVNRLKRHQNGDKQPIDVDATKGADGVSMRPPKPPPQPEVRRGPSPIASEDLDWELGIHQPVHHLHRHPVYYQYADYDMPDPRPHQIRRNQLYRLEPDDDAARDPRFHPRAKLDFPLYDGKEDPLPWLNRCESFFRGQHTPENRKVWYASLHLTGTAQLWYNRLELNSGTPSWRPSSLAFRSPMTDSPLGELAVLRRTGSVEYTDQYLSLACRDLELSEPQQVSLFVAGLGLAHAYEQRRLLNVSEPAQGRQPRTPTRPTPPASTAAASAPAPESLSSRVGSSTTSLPRRRLSPAEMAQRRADGLCFNCDEKFRVGHRCKKLFIMEVSFDPDGYDSDSKEADPVEPGISLHALTGVRALCNTTFKVRATVGTTTVTALLDSSSTHNFIDTSLAGKACIPLQARHGLSVAVANGDRIDAMGVCRNQCIDVAGEAFYIDLYALQLGGYDMVLGVQWPASLGPALWDFSRHTLCFTRNGTRALDKGRRALAAIDGCFHGAPRRTVGGTPARIRGPLPRTTRPAAGTPPQPPHPLEPGTTAVAVRPYRYAHIQKDELERQCDEMLRAGVIRPSTSAFSSPALLIKKRDGTWRFCVDYRALNDKTIKDKFPIPVVELS
ncbi:LOW QUALITY PROTEIN: hypothetical protein U9M48_013374 [Paspalum notatum var. saurae]|uniref:Uncharacterized protein n=1 Tax=Paspalum notatum var. saurae TaxID=547442 RepID=A0AAQ3T1J8_PASNO